ncbi:hypothetical protein [Rosettibacter firmus]|uniref:hypothetical protein n=1 Tax=Rosettibacter firmus TaxID=3111522 RepID=UPI00336BCB8F
MNDLNEITFIHLELTTPAIAIGERIKGGTFRPCIETIPTSTLKGSFRSYFGLTDALGIGFFRKETYERDIFTYAPFDAFLGTAKLPISLEYLRSASSKEAVEADIFIVKNDATEQLIRSLPTEISLGALKSRGFGRCKLRYIGEVKSKNKVGYLKGRLLEEEFRDFGITKIIKRRQGYLFYPISEVSGVYKKALFEGSIIEGPEILIKEEYRYDH